MCRSLSEAVAFREQRGEPERQVTRPRFSDFAEQWAMIHRSTLAPSTKRYYAGNLAHAVEALGDLYVDAIRPSDVRSWIARSAENYSPVTLNGWLRVVRQVLDDAVADGVLASNPARVVKGLSKGRTKGRRGNALALDEFRQFIAAVPGSGLAPDIGRLILTAAWTGCRKGELLALRWTDYVDGELWIERSVWHRQEKPTKTDDPRRVVVVEPLKEVLAEQRRWLVSQQHPALPTGLMFPADPRHAKAGATRRGVEEVSWYRSMTVLDRPIRKVVDIAKVTPISLHSLRRTWENLLRSAGVDQLVRRSMAGWRSEGAQRIYATVDKSERGAAADALIELVLGSDAAPDAAPEVERHERPASGKG